MGQHIRRISSMGRDSRKRILCQRISTDYKAIGTNDSGSFGMHVERLPYESGGMSEDVMSTLKDIVKAQQEKGNSVLVVLDFDCTVTQRHWSKTFHSRQQPYAKDFQNWRTSNKSPKRRARLTKARQMMHSMHNVFESF